MADKELKVRRPSRLKQAYTNSLLVIGNASRGIVLPKAWVRQFNLEIGDSINLRVKSDGTIMIRPALLPADYDMEKVIK